MSSPVDLKEQFEKKKLSGRGRPSLASAGNNAPKPQPAAKVKPAPEPDALEQMYREKDSGNIRQIERPTASVGNRKMGGAWAYQALIIILIAACAYLYFGNSRSVQPIAAEFPAGWYKITLDSGDYFYGHVGRFSDPLIITSVYYNYDQKSGQTSPDQNIRLIRAREDLSGTDGSVIVPFAGAKYEPLSPESKVLKAILEYER